MTFCQYFKRPVEGVWLKLTPTGEVRAACGRIGVAAVARAESCVGDAKEGTDDMLGIMSQGHSTSGLHST